MIYFPVKSLPNSANPSGINRYKIRKNNPLHFQHLRHHLVSAHSKGTSTPLDSAVTKPLSLTPLQSTLTKNRGRGEGTTRSSALFLVLLPKTATPVPRFLRCAHSLPDRPGCTPSSASPP